MPRPTFYPSLLLSSLLALALGVALLGGCERGPATIAGPPDTTNPDKRPCPPIAITYTDPATIDTTWSGGIKDFCVVPVDDGYHLFHITDPATSWITRNGELTFGHATTGDLMTWQTHDRIDLRTETDGWSPSFTWAPHIVERDGLYYMFYTGVKWDHGRPLSCAEQRVGLAISSDLETWQRYDKNGEDGLILDGPPNSRFWWSAYDIEAYDVPWEYDCRDPFVFDRGPEHSPLRYVMLNSVRIAPWAQYMAIAWAASDNLVDWQWGYIFPVTIGLKAESAALVEHDGNFYLFWTDRDDAPAVRVACSTTGIFGEYAVVNGGEALFGLANETVIEPERTLYLAFDDAYVLHVKRHLMLPETPSPSARVRVVDFTDCDDLGLSRVHGP